MPRYVDKDARREEILDAYLALVARDGIAKATTRALAQACGMSVGGLWIYYDSIDELRQAAFQRSFDQAGQNLSDPDAHRRGLDGLARTLEAILPLRAESATDARISMEFLDYSRMGDAMYDVQIRMETLWKEKLTARILEAQVDGELVPHAPAGDLADVLLGLVLGLQMEFVIGSHRGTARRSWEIVSLCLSPWLEPGRVLPLPPSMSTRSATTS